MNEEEVRELARKHIEHQLEEARYRVSDSQTWLNSRRIQLGDAEQEVTNWKERVAEGTEDLLTHRKQLANWEAKLVSLDAPEEPGRSPAAEEEDLQG